MNSFSIRDIHADKIPLGSYKLSGWVRTHRQSKNISFIEIADGSAVKGLQLVIQPTLAGYAEDAQRVATGAAIEVSGKLVASPAKGQKYEFQVDSFKLLGEADPESYPLQKKGHSLEFLREVLHLRPRTNTIGAMLRLRSVASMGIHTFFTTRGFYYVHTPIISTSDCEGAGNMFRVTTLDLLNIPRAEGKVDFSQDFFRDEASLTVSGQLEGEICATGIGKIYTFGPTFRAENSNTVRHLSEFWMIEPEMAFYALEDNMLLAEEFIKYLINYVLEHAQAEMEFFEKSEFTQGAGLIQQLQEVASSKFESLDYTKAIEILEKSGKAFEFPVKWGMDLQSEHERYLTDEYIKGPVFVVNYPKAIKAFYMRQNDDGKTVRAMDCLVPRLGEIIGGSQREERYDNLVSRMKEAHMDVERYWWYLDLRKYGTVPHSGFGLGFERFLMYVSGFTNIRDVTPFPRYPGYAKF